MVTCLLKGGIWIQLPGFMAFRSVVISLQDNSNQMAKAYNSKHKRQKPSLVVWLCQDKSCFVRTGNKMYCCGKHWNITCIKKQILKLLSHHNKMSYVFTVGVKSFISQCYLSHKSCSGEKKEESFLSKNNKWKQHFVFNLSQENVK